MTNPNEHDIAAAREIADYAANVLGKSFDAAAFTEGAASIIAKAASIIAKHHETERVELEEDSRLLGELLALMNGDGGHYQSEHGTKKAFERAVELRNTNYVVADTTIHELTKERDSLLFRLELAERKSRALDWLSTSQNLDDFFTRIRNESIVFVAPVGDKTFGTEYKTMLEAIESAMSKEKEQG